MKICGVFSHSNRILLGFTRGFLLDALKCEVDPFLILPSFACNSCTLYIPNTHVASAFRCILLIRVYSLCSLWVYFTMFTLDLLWVHSSRPVVNPAFTPKCLSLLSVRLDLISTVIMHKCNYLKAEFDCIYLNFWSKISDMSLSKNIHLYSYI